MKEGESFESALRRFKKKCEKAGILADLRRHQHFEKPSERRKRKMNAAKRKNMTARGRRNSFPLALLHGLTWLDGIVAVLFRPVHDSRNPARHRRAGFGGFFSLIAGSVRIDVAVALGW